jgi:cytochrome c-type biogenesis protein CcmH
MIRPAAALALALAVTLTAPRVAAAQGTPAQAAPRDTALERQVQQVAAQLRCPVCQGLSILDSPSELAQDMKGLVRDQLAAGATPEEVRKYFVDRYGEWVLLKPPAHGANLAVWLLPVVVLVGGAIALWMTVRRWTRDAPDGGAAPEGTPAELRARRDALRQMLLELQEDFAEGKVLDRDYEALRQRDEAELAALNAAIKEAKKARAASPPAGPAVPAARTRRIPPAVGWTVGLAAFAAVAVLSLRGALAPRSAGGTMTGIQFEGSGGGAPEEGGGAGPVGTLDAADSAQLASLEQRVARDSNDYPALLELGHLYMRQQRLSRAADVSMRAVRLRPQARETAEAFAHLGMILWNANELQGGLQALDQALFLHPATTPACTLARSRRRSAPGS